jgi:hypothetical protein
MPLLKPIEAITKRCPPTFQGAPSNCIADQCMWWRWNPSNDNRRRFHAAPMLESTQEQERPSFIPSDWEWHPYDEEEGEPAGWTEPQASVEARRLGFCGAAVRPFED